MLEFRSLEDKEMLVPLGAEGWRGWNFETGAGYIESPPAGSTGFSIRNRLFDSRDFRVEFVIRIEEQAGAFSFSLEGEDAAGRLGFHLNPGEVILFASRTSKRVPFSCSKGRRVRVRFSNRAGGRCSLFVDGRPVAATAACGVAYSGKPVVRIDSTRVRIYSVHAASGR